MLCFFFGLGSGSEGGGVGYVRELTNKTLPSSQKTTEVALEIFCISTVPSTMAVVISMSN